MGIVVAVLHSRLRHVKFPTVLSFFQGSRFIPFASTLVFAAVGQVFPFVWVWFSKGINALAGGISNLGMFGPFVYGTVEKLLIPIIDFASTAYLPERRSTSKSYFATELTNAFTSLMVLSIICSRFM